MKKPILLFFVLIFSISAFARVKTGIEVLRDDNFSVVRGKRIGLITNATGVDAELNSTVDILHSAPGVKLVSLFAPEHGVRGDVAGGGVVANQKDARTGLPVHSLYGRTFKPTPEMLRGLDALVYDIQDIGCRSYTFISTMGKAMEAASEQGLEFIVLDRPNPLGGERVEGPMTVEPGFKSFVSQYSIPYVYGLTAGELALWINKTQLGGKCKLHVVKMEGWRRSMTFDQTGLPWVPTSPNIPTAETAFFYPAMGIMGELGSVSIGANYTMPFRVAVNETVDALKLTEYLNGQDIPGVRFRAVYLSPGGKHQKGVQVYILDPKKATLTAIQFHIIRALMAIGQKPFAVDNSRLNLFDKVCGSKSVRQALMNPSAPIPTFDATSWKTSAPKLYD
ncbi:MAG: DUF1343 domain-containing protein [Muribaculaceae bacterium]|nr:DUF1343 domain-containing protein [Muribaculaceae bacterium]